MSTGTAESTSSLPNAVSRLWTHLVDLGALQCRLFAVEFRRSSSSLQTAMLLTLAGGVLFLSAVPLLLAAAALQLSASAGLSIAASLAIVAVVALLLMWPALAAAHRITKNSVKELTSPVRDLEINLRSLAGETPSPTPAPSYSPNPFANGAE